MHPLHDLVAVDPVKMHDPSIPNHGWNVSMLGTVSTLLLGGLGAAKRLESLNSLKPIATIPKA